jgi:zinc protease
MKISKLKISLGLILTVSASNFSINAQTETPPAPSAPKSVTVPAVKEQKLKNGLRLAVVERKNLPVVTMTMLIKSGASAESYNKAGLANLTASLLTKGTTTKSATQIAEAMEALGGSINTGAAWNNSVVNVSVMTDKLDRAMAIMSDVLLNPAFKQDELDLLKSQTLDSLTANLKQPGFLANYVASKYSFNEHPAGGTPDSLGKLTQGDISEFVKANYYPENAILIFTGDITALNAKKLAQKYFGNWKSNGKKAMSNTAVMNNANSNGGSNRFLIVDLPKSGQASVSYQKYVQSVGRGGNTYFPASVLNSVLGGGYSSRLNQEIRIKRGLSYGAGSGFAWRSGTSNFGTRTQTKNESAAEVAELVLAEVKKLSDGSIADAELTPRKSVLTGNFGRNLETTEGLAGAVADLYSFGLSPSELNSYASNVNNVNESQIRDFAKISLLGGDIIIVGDYSVFKDDLAKRFPNTKVEVIKADELDLSKDNLRK